jgi:Flp pilus assembly protein TadG
MITTRKEKHRRNKGQAVVELALTLPIVLLLTLGIMEGGWLMFVYTSLSSAGREAARYGAGIGSNGSGTILYNDCNGIKAAAMRIGQFAGITASDIHIYHDTGPAATSRTEYCTTPTDTTTLTGNQRILVQIDINYRPISPVGPFQTFPLHSESAHTILMGADVVAKPQTFSGGGTICDVSKYTISQDQPLGPIDTITITNGGGTATKIVNILVVWDLTSSPVLNSIRDLANNPLPGLVGLPSNGPMYTSAVNIPFAAGTMSQFKMNFSKTLKYPLLILLTLDTPENCNFGIH